MVKILLYSDILRDRHIHSLPYTLEGWNNKSLVSVCFETVLKSPVSMDVTSLRVVLFLISMAASFFNDKLQTNLEGKLYSSLVTYLYTLPYCGPYTFL